MSWNYETSVVWNGGETGTVGANARPDLAFSSPPEFGGKEDLWNPELMLVSAIEACMLLTTLSIVQRQKIALTAYSSKASGNMAKTPNGLRFQSCHIEVTLTIPAGDDADKAAQAVHTAERYCPVSNAVNFPVTVGVKVQDA
ncbi:MAG: OsmC family protein [Verrucomicrobia bacterium]|nr:OsmC family protein [Kiritimatiellia bacterium]MCO6401027.1 OsmC family protein [Verrucomicrobiota bacterium]